MKFVAFVITLCAILLVSYAAKAQHVQVPGTPTTTIHDNTLNRDVLIGVWAENSLVGDYLILAEYDPGQGWLGIWTSDPMYVHFTPTVTGNAKGFILLQLEALNNAIANRFALASTSPPTTGQPVDAVNLALYQFFKFTVLSNGKTVLAPK